MRRAGLLGIGMFLCVTAPLAGAQSNRISSADPKQRAASLFEEGQTAQARGDLNAAVRLYTSAISSDPSIFQAYYQRAVALTGLGRIPEAEGDLRKVIELQPGFARAHRALGQLFLDKGMTDEAKRELARAIELDQNLSDVRVYYASALLKAGEPARAAEQLRAAIQQGEATALTFALLGVAEERTGKAAEALADYSRAIEMNSNEATAREGRGGLFAARGDVARAIEDYSIAYRAQPSPGLALTLADLHRRAGQLQAAIQIYRELSREKPEDITLRGEIVRLMIENGQADEAARELELLIKGQPGNPALLALAGDVYTKEKPELAASYYRRAADSDPNNNGTRVQLGAALVRSRQFPEALSVLGEALKREPNNYQAHANLATALFELKQYPSAAREFVWLVRARPQLAVAYYFLAISLDKLGDCEQALRAYGEFVRRADTAANKKEIEDATIRLSLLQKLAKDGKCKSPVKGKGR